MLRRSKTDEAAHGPTRVLVVDDDPDACELVARIIESAGWGAARAHSAEEAMSALVGGQPPFTALVLDFVGAGTDAALGVLEEVRRRPEVADVAVVVVAASRYDRDRVWQAGADGLLVRPFHADDLVNELYAVFTRTPDERAAFRAEQLATG
ncbi:response regulator [Rhabdothermincola sp.]|uniref:response regulator n=1 Tax=Rhabdothermincola sp. TaxID=2820405 RepID=UPI002FDF89E7